jgi:hypothetical protein
MSRMRQRFFNLIDEIEGTHWDWRRRNEQLLRNGRWGDCVDCWINYGFESAGVHPERCPNTQRYDHNIRVNPRTLRLVRRYRRAQLRRYLRRNR